MSRLLTMLRAVLPSLRSEAGREVVRNTVGLLLCTTLSQLCNFGVVLLTARHLGPAGVGVFGFALTVQFYLAQLGGAGAAQVLVREVTADRERTDEYVTAYLSLVLSATLLTSAVALVPLLLVSVPREEFGLYAWVLAGNLASSLSLLPLFDAHHRQARAALVMAAVDALTVLLFLASALTDSLDLVRAGQLMALKWWLIVLGHLLVFHRTVRPLRWLLRGSTFRLFLSSGYRVLLVSLLFLIPLNGGVLLARWLRSEAETGILSIATQMATVHLLFCLQVARIVQPHITGPHGLERWFVRKMALAYAGITLGLTLGAALLGTVVIVWLLPDFTAALPPLFLLLLGSLLLAFGYVESLYLHRFRRETAILRCYTVGGLVFVGLAVWLIGNWGPIGSGVALVASAGVSAGLMAACLLASAEPGTSSGSSESTTAAES